MPQPLRAELLTIGTELLNGATVNTNAAYLARRLAETGIRCARQVAVSDERADLQQALAEGVTRANVLIITGGLGPTCDDVTIAALAEVAHRPLRCDADVVASIRRFYTRRRRALQQAALRQADLPEGGIALSNPLGTAPGLCLPLTGWVVVALPGVPSEMRAIMERHVLPRLRRLAKPHVIESRTIRTAGLVELLARASSISIRS